ncbi:hypothetical protein HHI36_024257 [Cryptolaemus montrouzieri]|uniref:Uncharacterized protein n=1 Tax=Cryptolaemus montrouzieri TaxID=559131 RepID=A0ABD2NIF9_9CUCU
MATIKQKNFSIQEEILDANEDTSSAKNPKITILEAISMIYDAWNKLKSTTIFNCYKHAGFVRDGPGIADSISVAADNNDDDVPLSVCARALKEGLPIKNEKLEQYSSIDDDIATCEEPNEENILQNVIVNCQDSEDNDVDDGPEENCPTPSVSEALKAAEVLNLFVHSNFDDDTMKSIMSCLHNAVRTSYNRNKNQKLQTF